MLGGDGAFELAPKSAQVTARVDRIAAGREDPDRQVQARRRGYRRHTGFRAKLSQIEIESIGSADREEGSSAAKKAEPARRSRTAPAKLVHGVRGPDGRGDLGEGRLAGGRAGRGGAGVRTRPRQAQGRAGGARSEEGTPRWLIRKDSARRGTAATRTRRCSASRSSTARRQRGDDHRPPARDALPPGPGAGIGRDDTIFAKRDGTVGSETTGERRFVSVTE